jgi:hypothetical protein
MARAASEHRDGTPVSRQPSNDRIAGMSRDEILSLSRREGRIN